MLFFGWEDVGVLHSQRLKDACFKELLERLPRDDFDDARERCNPRIRVLPFCAWVKFQRLLRFHEHYIREWLVQVTMQLLDAFRRVQAHSGSVRHEIAEGNQPGRTA
jgi:hypothetical protein